MKKIDYNSNNDLGQFVFRESHSLGSIASEHTFNAQVQNHVQQKSVPICQCKWAIRIKYGNGLALTVADKEDNCIYCKHAVVYYRVKKDWTPADGLRRVVHTVTKRKKPVDNGID